ncbi:MipA/OmpV family protein [Pelagibius litoralis]|uniref:MipA/OmpV family protein n=1 Tax=Pelagibius litoralis TaxID=374515 RepID=A0A967KCM4_9PROT|nr:MipA/OmpV family protein [Pelagibius litoralis]NIA71757.1 MipA/OmpV family protein [Pelagibius litoralis]
MQEQSLPFRFIVAALTSAPWLFSAPALADESQSSEQGPSESGGGVSGFIALGPAVSPEYEGSSDYEPVPLIISRVDALGLSLEIEGLDARLNVLPDSRFQFGPAVTYRPGRDDVSNDVVDRLSSIDDAFEFGGFLRYQFTELFDPRDEFELSAQVLADVTGTHEGLTATLGGGYAIFFGQRWRLGLDTGITFASDDYMQTYFGIDARDSARSGLQRYDSDGGLKDVGVEATLSYNFTERWGVLGRVEYTRLLGDAADSPIVDDEGSPDQLFGGLAISYRF